MYYGTAFYTVYVKLANIKMRILRNLKKNIPKAVIATALLVSLLAVAMPPAPSLAAPDDKGGKAAAKKKPAKPDDTTIKATGDQSDISGGSLPTPNADNSTIKTALEIVFGIIGAFAVLNITLSGLKYITSAGNEQKVAEAKNGIVYSLVGLMIAISAEAIVAFVVSGVKAPLP